MLSEDITVSNKGARPQFSHGSHYSGRATDKQMASADVILTMLHTIARESEHVHAVSRALFAARATACAANLAMATSQLSHACNLLASGIAGLQKLVLEFDEGIAGARIRSLAELGVRARTLAVLLLLDELCDAMLYRSSLYRELFIGKLKDIEDVVWYLFDALAHINRMWLRHRVVPRPLAAESAPRIFDMTRSLQYRTAIRHAQSAIAALGADPDIAHFLRAGASRTDAPRVRRACDQLVDVLSVAFTREPDPALFLTAAAAVLDPEKHFDLSGDDNTVK